MGKNGLSNIDYEAYRAAVQEAAEEAGVISRNIAEEVVQADKDILSKITVEYDETNDRTLITFPKGIIPLDMKFGTAVYNQYRYQVGSEVDATINNLYSLQSSSNVGTVEVDSDKVVIKVSGDNSNIYFSALSYLLGNKGLKLINAYALYHPVTSSGTKLYKHTLSFTGSSYLTLVTLISYDNTEINTKTLFFDKILKAISVCVGNNFNYPMLIAQPGPQKIYLAYGTSDDGFTFYSDTFTAVSDTVTEL